MAHPYLTLLSDRLVRVLWAGHAFSALGSELYRVGVVWLAVELAGPKASLLTAAQSATILVMSLAGGAFAELMSRRRLLIGADLLCAAASGGVVIAALTFGLSFPILVLSTVMLAAIGAVAYPTFMSSVPRVAPPERLREATGLFDGTTSAAMAIGPFIAAAAMGILPAVHLITANGLSFLASAAAVAAVGKSIEPPPEQAAPKDSVWARLARGAAAANACPGAWHALVSTSIRGGAYALGFGVAVPLLFSQDAASGGLAAVAVVFGAAAAGDVLASPFLVLFHPRRPLLHLFAGSAVAGLAMAAIGAAAILEAPLQLPAMALCAAVMGATGALARLQLMHLFGARMTADGFAAVLRLRLAMGISAMLAATLAGPWILEGLGPVGTMLLCGAATALAAIVAGGALALKSRG